MISDQIQGGLSLTNTITILDQETIYIQKNGEYAISIPESSMKKFIHFYVNQYFVFFNFL